jgi:hypothetical protein
VPIFIGRGAPFAYKTTNISVRDLFACNDGLQDILADDDSDGLVVDFDRVDDQADVALPGIGIAVVELIGHQARKCIDLLGIYSRDGAALGEGAVECGLGAFPFGLQTKLAVRLRRMSSISTTPSSIER